MTVIPAILVCMIPLAAVFICIAVLVKDFSLWWGFLACILGLVCVIPAAATEFFFTSGGLIKMSSLWIVLLNSLLINGLIEETVKMGALFLIPAKDKSVSMFVSCGILLGASLSCFENLVYLLSGYENIGVRLATSLVIHCGAAFLSSIFVYSVKAKKFYLYPFMVAVLCHGIYNYFAGFKMAFGFFCFSIIVVLVTLVECRIRYRSFQEQLKKAE